MTGPEHYAEAERLMATQPFCMCERTDCEHGRAMLAYAQVHATLALAAATAYVPSTLEEQMADQRAWRAAGITDQSGPDAEVTP